MNDLISDQDDQDYEALEPLEVPTTSDCDVTAIDGPFLEGAIAFLTWVHSRRQCLPAPENPYNEDLLPFEHQCWFVGWDDGEKLWESWQ